MTVKLMRPNDIAEGFAEAVQKIEDKVFFDLNFFLGPFDLPNATLLAKVSGEPRGERRHQQPEEKKTHETEARLFRCGPVLEVLF